MTFDPRKNEKPFGLLTKDEREILKNCGGPWEVVSSKGWCLARYPQWIGEYTYRQTPLTKPQINWDHVEERWKYLCRDENGDAFLWIEEPKCYRGVGIWTTYWPKSDARAFASYVPGTCHWTESLICRPNFEGEK